MRLLVLASAVIAASLLVSAPASRAALLSTCAASAAPTVSATIQITEVEADPLLSGSDTANEWFELTNVGSSTATLTNWTISDSAANDPLPPITLVPGHCIVVAATSGGFLAEHAGYVQPFVTIADGAIGNGLANGGDLLTLNDGNGAVVDCVAWGSASGCFAPAVAATAANTSATLQRVSSVDSDTAADWASAWETPCPVAPTAARVVRFGAAAIGPHSVRLSWTAPVAEDLVGFRVWRRGPRGFVRAGSRLIAVHPGAYRVVDRGLGRVRGLRYRLQAVLLDGHAEWAGSARVT